MQKKRTFFFFFLLLIALFLLCSNQTVLFSNLANFDGPIFDRFHEVYQNNGQFQGVKINVGMKGFVEYEKIFRLTVSSVSHWQAKIWRFVAFLPSSNFNPSMAAWPIITDLAFLCLSSHSKSPRHDPKISMKTKHVKIRILPAQNCAPFLCGSGSTFRKPLLNCNYFSVGHVIRRG